MTTRLIIDTRANLEKYPKSFDLREGDCVTIGDLHGNVIKFIYFLIKQGILEFKNGQNDYQEILNICCTQTDSLTKKHLDQFKVILNQSRFTLNAKKIMIRLLGDEVADRGSNDYFTLLVFDILQNNNIQFEIILSNHSAAFLQCYEEKFLFRPTVGLCASYDALQELLINSLVTQDEINKLIRRCYYKRPSRLKLLSYSIEYTTEFETFTIYTHAPVGLEVVEGLAKKFDINYSEVNTQDLKNSIDSINNKFNDLIIDKGIKFIVSEEQDLISKNSLDVTNVNPRIAPVVRCLWNRRHQDQYRIRNNKNSKETFNIRYVHGHDGADGVYIDLENIEEKDKAPHIINLDTCLGDPYSTKGLLSQQKQYIVEIFNQV